MEFYRSSRRLQILGSVILLLSIHVAHSFYLPGVAPQDFEKVKMNSISNLIDLDLIYIS
jgi:transmembrane 9 superfamily protein 2/4